MADDTTYDPNENGEDDLDDATDLEDEDEEEDPDESSDGSTEGGGDASDGGDGDGAPDAASGTERLSGRALLAALADDPEANTLLARGFEELRRQAASEEAARKEAADFTKLVEDGDYETVGRTIIERARDNASRARVVDEALQNVFTPAYTELFAELGKFELTDEEKSAMQPDNFESDAHYVRGLSELLATKRKDAEFEQEVTRRIKAREDAAKNAESAKVALKPAGRTPPAMSSDNVTGRRTSSDLISAGLRARFNIDGDGDDTD